MSKATVLRKLLLADDVTLAMETYDAISAKIAETAGFKCLWASGFSITASCGLRDFDEITATQMLQHIEFMADITQIPILFDGDTGYGNFNNLRLLIKKLGRIGIAGITLEDPKMKSPPASPKKYTPADLENLAVFCGKIKAAKDAQVDSNFNVIARTHAPLYNANVEETIQRAIAYKEAGADAIFVHARTTETILSFANIWHHQLHYSLPLIIAPVGHYDFTSEQAKQAKIAILILGTFTLRASVKAIQQLAEKLRNGASIAEVEKDLPPLREVLKLVNNDELLEAEKRYTLQE